MPCIQQATADDIPQMAQLLGVLFAAEADFRPDVAKQIRGLRLIVDNPARGCIFVAREGRDVVGMVSLLFSVSTAEGAEVCWLEDMVVRPDRRRAGLGSRLLEHAVAQARAQGLTRITLLTDRTNEEAQRFYGRHGFCPSAMMPWRLHLK